MSESDQTSLEASDGGARAVTTIEPLGTHKNAFEEARDKATEALAQLGEKFRQAPQPGSPEAEYEAFKADPKQVSAYLNGDLVIRQKVEKLRGILGDRVDREMAGVTDPVSSDVIEGITAHERVAEINRMREAGIDDGSIEQLFRGKPLASKVEYDAVKEYERATLADPSWVKRFLAGDRAAVQEMAYIKIALLAGYEEAA